MQLFLGQRFGRHCIAATVISSWFISVAKIEVPWAHTAIRVFVREMEVS